MSKHVVKIAIKQLKAGTQYGEAQGVYELENVNLVIDVEGEMDGDDLSIDESELTSLIQRLRTISTLTLDEIIKKPEEVSPKTSDY